MQFINLVYSFDKKNVFIVLKFLLEPSLNSQHK